MNNSNNNISPSEEVVPFTGLDISSSIEGTNAYLIVSSNLVGNKIIKIQVESSIKWVKPSSINIDNEDRYNTYTLDELFTEPKNKELFDEWKKNIASEIESEKAKLITEFQNEFTRIGAKIISQGHDLNNYSDIQEYFKECVTNFDIGVVYPGEYDMFIINEPFQRFFEQYGLDYMKAIRAKNFPEQAISEYKDSVENIIKQQ